MPCCSCTTGSPTFSSVRSVSGYRVYNLAPCAVTTQAARTTAQEFAVMMKAVRREAYAEEEARMQRLYNCGSGGFRSGQAPARFAKLARSQPILGEFKAALWRPAGEQQDAARKPSIKAFRRASGSVARRSDRHHEALASAPYFPLRGEVRRRQRYCV